MSHSLRGYFLVAGSQLRDPNFFKTAVLMVEHGPEGAMGLVVNRPSSVSVSQALTGHLDMPDNGELVYVGGPVEPSALFVIHNADQMDPSEGPVVPGVFMGSSADIFEEVVTECSPDLKYRVFCGCAGWGPGQLEQELSRCDWLTVKADSEMIFQDNAYEIWDQLVSRCFQKNRLLPFACEHPEWN